MKIRIAYGHHETDDIITIDFVRPTDAYDFLQVLMKRENDRLIEFRIIRDNCERLGGEDK